MGSHIHPVRRGLRILTVWPLVWAMLSGACGSNQGTRVDGSAAEVGIDLGMAAPEGPAPVQESCANAATICVGSQVFSCVDHQPADLLEECSAACSLGRCTTVTCADVERTEARRGCRFYGVQMDNVDGEDGHKMMVLLSNGGSEPAEARIEVPADDGTWAILQSATVAPSGGQRLRFNRPNVSPGVSRAVAFRVETTAPVLAVAIVSDDVERTARSSAGTALLPAQALERQYIAVTSPSDASASVAATPGGRAGAGVITVIATVPNTHVTLRLTAPALVQVAGVVGPPPASYDVPAMRAGDVLQVFSVGPGADLTGTTVMADYPVAVFSGNIFTSYSYGVTGFNGGDMAQEQLPPVASWGHQYVGARLSPQMACDSFFGVGAGLWRVVAAENGTRVTIAPAVEVSVDWPNLPTSLEFNLDAGGSQLFFARPNLKAMSPADVLVTANRPILLAQWLDCEPGLAWGIDTRLSSAPLSFTLPPNFEHELIIVKKAGTSVTLDGRPQNQEHFTVVSLLPGYEAMRVAPSDLGSCADLQEPCDHLVTGKEFGVTWRGMDVVCSYALTIPSADQCALPSAPCQIN